MCNGSYTCHEGRVHSVLRLINNIIILKSMETLGGGFSRVGAAPERRRWCAVVRLRGAYFATTDDTDKGTGGPA